MKARTARTLGWLAHCAVAAAFALAGSLKLADPVRFAADIGHYRLVSPTIAAAAAVYLPWFELTLAVALLMPRWCGAARILATGLLLGFCAALASAAWRGIDLRCGCFGEATATGVTGALLRNAVLLLLLAIAAWLGRARPPCAP